MERKRGMNGEVEKRTPLYEVARQARASFERQDGWLVAGGYGEEPAGLETGGLQLGLADCSARAKVLVEGTNAAALLERAWNVSAPETNGGVELLPGAAYRLRHDRFFLSAPPDDELALIGTLEGARRAQDGLITITAATHGRAELWLLGSAAPELLSRLCGIDLHPDRFPEMSAQQTSVAKTAQLVIHTRVGQTTCYALVGPRSLGAYLWQTIIAAAHDLPLQFYGESRLRTLAGQQERHARS